MSAAELLGRDACAMADAVRAGTASATALVQASLARVDATDGRVNAFTDGAVRARAAPRRAGRCIARLGQRRAHPRTAAAGRALRGEEPVRHRRPAHARRLEDRTRQTAPARADAALVRRLERAGAVLVGALNMDEYAYGFTTENSHEGPTRNPHDLTRIAGGSSGGSGAAVAAGQVPLTLGSDTNGSIRVPASLCGVFGLKPTFGRLPRTGSFPFVSSLDHLGPFARSARDLALVYDAMQGPEEARRPARPRLRATRRRARVAFAGPRHARPAHRRARRLLPRARGRRGIGRRRPRGRGIGRDRLAGQRRAADGRGRARRRVPHHQRRRRRAAPGRPAPPRARLRAALARPLPRRRAAAGGLGVARAARAPAYAEAVARLFGRYDILLAPATPSAATPIGAETFEVNGHPLPVRPNMGLLTQPFSCIGLPVCAVPVWGAHASCRSACR
jgi:Asp-tRNA(Asn)/Glu-tRNA(Gln) amidotransferase A subunit family amidase